MAAGIVHLHRDQLGTTNIFADGREDIRHQHRGELFAVHLAVLWAGVVSFVGIPLKGISCALVDEPAGILRRLPPEVT